MHARCDMRLVSSLAKVCVSGAAVKFEKAAETGAVSGLEHVCQTWDEVRNYFPLFAPADLGAQRHSETLV